MRRWMAERGGGPGGAFGPRRSSAMRCRADDRGRSHAARAEPAARPHRDDRLPRDPQRGGPQGRHDPHGRRFALICAPQLDRAGLGDAEARGPAERRLDGASVPSCALARKPEVGRDRQDAGPSGRRFPFQPPGTAPGSATARGVRSLGGVAGGRRRDRRDVGVRGSRRAARRARCGRSTGPSVGIASRSSWVASAPRRRRREVALARDDEPDPKGPSERPRVRVPPASNRSRTAAGEAAPGPMSGRPVSRIVSRRGPSRRSAGTRGRRRTIPGVAARRGERRAEVVAEPQHAELALAAIGHHRPGRRDRSGPPTAQPPTMAAIAWSARPAARTTVSAPRRSAATRTTRAPARRRARRARSRRASPRRRRERDVGGAFASARREVAGRRGPREPEAGDRREGRARARVRGSSAPDETQRRTPRRSGGTRRRRPCPGRGPGRAGRCDAGRASRCRDPSAAPPPATRVGQNGNSRTAAPTTARRDQRSPRPRRRAERRAAPRRATAEREGDARAEGDAHGDRHAEARRRTAGVRRRARRVERDLEPFDERRAGRASATSERDAPVGERPQHERRQPVAAAPRRRRRPGRPVAASPPGTS